MRIEYIREYILLCSKLNYTATAKELYITQPVLSRHIAALEKDLGVNLLERNTQSVTLTPAGEYSLKEFSKIIDRYDLLKNKLEMLSNDHKAYLNIGALYYAFEEYVTPMLQIFNSSFPNVQLAIHSYQPHALINALLSDKIDLGLVMRMPFLQQNIQFYKIMQEPLVAMVHSSHPLANESVLSIEKFRNQPVVLEQADTEFSNYVKYLLLLHNFNPDCFAPSQQVDTLPFTLKETGGVTFVPEHIGSNIRIGDSRFIKLEERDFAIDMCWAYKSNNDNPIIKIFLESSDRYFK